MVRAPRSRSIKAIANQIAADDIWGAPESPEFSAVQRLMHEFQTHENEEGRWLSIYKKVADGSQDPLIRFLLSLIIADEARHRELMGRMVSLLKDDLAWTRAEVSTSENRKAEKNDAKLLAMVGRFLEMERRGIREYEKLIRTSQGFHQGLFTLLCKTMIHDSLKHIGILEFVGLKLREAQGCRTIRKSQKTRRHSQD